MNNVLPRSLKMHYKYDLKGSTYKRRASRKEREKACPTYKDLDFVDMHDGLYFDTETYNALMKTLQRDCRVSATLFWQFSNKKRVSSACANVVDGFQSTAVVVSMFGVLCSVSPIE